MTDDNDDGDVVSGLWLWLFTILFTSTLSLCVFDYCDSIVFDFKV